MTSNPETIPLLCQPLRSLSRLTTRVGCRSHGRPQVTPQHGVRCTLSCTRPPRMGARCYKLALVSSTCGASWGSARPCDPAPWGRAARGAHIRVAVQALLGAEGPRRHGPEHRRAPRALAGVASKRVARDVALRHSRPASGAPTRNPSARLPGRRGSGQPASGRCGGACPRDRTSAGRRAGAGGPGARGAPARASRRRRRRTGARCCCGRRCRPGCRCWSRGTRRRRWRPCSGRTRSRARCPSCPARRAAGVGAEAPGPAAPSAGHDAAFRGRQTAAAWHTCRRAPLPGKCPASTEQCARLQFGTSGPRGASVGPGAAGRWRALGVRGRACM